MSGIDVDVLYRALEKRYQAPAWALITNLANGTGGRITGFADAIAMSLWPSRGLLLYGFELKVSRSDWLRELKQPKKAEAFVRYCDRWMLVTPPGIVEPGELPEPWGHLVLQGQKLVEKVEPSELEPEPINRTLLASLLRRVHDNVSERSARAYADGLERGRSQGPQEFETERSQLKSRIRQLEERQQKFEKASGIALDGWALGQIGELVGELVLLRGFGPTGATVHLERAKRVLEDAGKKIAEQIQLQKELEKAAAQLRAPASEEQSA